MFPICNALLHNGAKYGMHHLHTQGNKPWLHPHTYLISRWGCDSLFLAARGLRIGLLFVSSFIKVNRSGNILESSCMEWVRDNRKDITHIATYQNYRPRSTTLPLEPSTREREKTIEYQCIKSGSEPLCLLRL